MTMASRQVNDAQSIRPTPRTDEIDVGRFLRLQGALHGAASSYPWDSAVMGSAALAGAYERLRAETAEIIPEPYRAELDRLFPHDAGPRSPGDPRMMAKRFSQAKTLLDSLAGWLGGFVREAQLEIESEGLAKAKAAGRARS